MRITKSVLYYVIDFANTSLCTSIVIIKGGNLATLALGCQFQFGCVETQMSGFSFGLVSRLLKNRFQFRSRATSVSGFRFKFHPRKLFYGEYGLFKSPTSWRFCFITMISSRSVGRVRRAIALEVVDLGMIPSLMKPTTQKLVLTASLFDAQR